MCVRLWGRVLIVKLYVKSWTVRLFPFFQLFWRHLDRFFAIALRDLVLSLMLTVC